MLFIQQSIQLEIMIVSERVRQRYKNVLTALFDFLHQKQYKQTHVFTDKQLEDITHEQVLGWLRFKCFKTINPTYDDNLRAEYRKNTVQFWKKALSHFLSDEQTKSKEMNQLMALLGQLQVRNRGKRNQARDTLSNAGFQHLLQGLQKDIKNDTKKDGNSQYRARVRKFGIPAMLCYQFAMIGRLDDCTQLLAENLQCHDQFPTYALKSKMTWSKNVMDERDAPWQILLGSLLTLYCVFVNVGIWLEIQLEATQGAQMSPYVFSFSQDFSIPSGGKKASSMAAKMVSAVFGSDQFYQELNVGTHSIRKFAATHCRNSGIGKDDVESRGRWRDGRRVANRYEDPTLPFVDTRACEKLCQGGACTYVPKSGCVTQEFLCSYVVPAIATKFGANVAMIFGSAVMWTIFSSNSDMVPDVIRVRVTKAYEAFPNKLPGGENPIERRKLTVCGEGHTFTLFGSSDNAHVQEETSTVPMNVNGWAGGMHGPVGDTALFNFLTVTRNQLTEVRQGQIEVVDTITSVKNDVERMSGNMQQFQRTLTTKVNRISRQPHRMFQFAVPNVAINAAPNHVAPVVVHPEPEPQMDMNIGEMDMNIGEIAHHAAGLHATLSPTPRNLYVLWQEYYVGVDGRKPAKDFSSRERGGTHKVTYCRRKKFWQLVVQLIHSGSSADDACKKIYNAYGHDATVTSILTRIAKDQSDGTLPSSLQLH